MLLVHQTGSVKVGEIVRYTVTYEPSADRILPSPEHLFVRIKNTAAIPLRAAYLHGPYAIHVAVYPQHFDPNSKVEDPRKYGIPQFEPNLKAGGSFSAKIPVPENIRVTGSGSGADREDHAPSTVTWIVEVTSQVLFSSSASVNYEVLISRDERSLDYSFATLSGTSHGQSEPGRVEDHQQPTQRHGGHRTAPTKGVYSKAVKLVVDNTESLWNTPPFPKWEQEQDKARKSVDSRKRESANRSNTKSKKEEEEEKKKKRKIHLVVLTHGLHSNLSADMLYLKESIDATAKQARESKRKRKEEARAQKGSSDGGVGDGQQDDVSDSEGDEEEEIMVRGFTGNVVKTENGIQWLGKRMAKWILDETYPDQPYKPIRRSMSQKFANAMGSKKSESGTGTPTHNGSTIRMEDVSNADLPYTFSSISFIGHSLGGLIQLYAIGYIQKHAPEFFDHINPVNFVCMASPLLGLSNENPMYVKFALDFGLVGRSGQDLGLTWRPPALAKSGWSAMGFGSASKGQENPDPGAKPLLRILPTGPAHRVLRRFRNRTVYANVVNDGVVPLRTSCLLFLDWRGLNRVEKARRENGIIGTVANWGWSELTGASSSPHLLEEDEDSRDDSRENSDDDGKPRKFEETVPQPAEDETNQDYQEQRANGAAEHHYARENQNPEPPTTTETRSPHSPSALDGLRNFLGLTSKTTKKDLKMYQRSQTILIDDGDAPAQPKKSNEQPRGRAVASRGYSMEGDSNSNAPPKTSIFESAGDILNPPIPPSSWITDPSTRVRTIFHDRVYHPEDIPAPPKKALKAQDKSGSKTGLLTADAFVGSSEVSNDGSSGMKVEEKIARAYHKDLSWRKVLVRLEPDAHNNMIVRRMFANAYGWPVVKHLCDTHFADTYSARTRDEKEPATDRARGVERPVGEHGEHVKGQEDIEPPPRLSSEMREAADELMPLRQTSSRDASRPTTVAGSSMTASSSYDSYDSRYYNDSDEDEENKGIMPRFWSPPPLFGGKGADDSAESSKRASTTKSEDEHYGTSQAEIADFLTTEPGTLMEGHRGLAPTPLNPAKLEPSKSTTDVGLRKSVEEMTRPVSGGEAGKKESVGESVAKALGKAEGRDEE